MSSFLASSNFCHLLINFVKSWDPDQNVSPERFDTKFWNIYEVEHFNIFNISCMYKIVQVIMCLFLWKC